MSQFRVNDVRKKENRSQKAPGGRTSRKAEGSLSAEGPRKELGDGIDSRSWTEGKKFGTTALRSRD